MAGGRPEAIEVAEHTDSIGDLMAFLTPSWSAGRRGRKVISCPYFPICTTHQPRILAGAKDDAPLIGSWVRESMGFSVTLPSTRE